ncbi:MAG: single-stranded-DNA-specific exonuclease RecJ [Anaerolineae bacterium]|nr:single-stranded-DNA-specific exonuclease RecJ [Anaerolineae bacterium]
MPIPSKRWRLPQQAPASFHDALPEVNPLVRQVLFARGFTTPEAVRSYLAGGSDRANPFDLPQMSALVARLRQAIRQREEIAVYGDYDADGITGLVVLITTLQALGAQARPYIPHRMTEEYGLNRQALAQLRKQGVRVVLTVDCGVRSVDEVAYGRSIGLDMLITDHHSIPEVLPEANALVNPKLPGSRYPFADLAGVGVAYRVAQALLRVARRVPEPGGGPVELEEESLLDLVALGTVADLAPLVGENRTLVREGLARLNASPRPGIRALLEVSGLAPGHVDAEEIAFGLGPRLNAAGRLDTALRAYELLSTTDPDRALELAAELNEINSERQRLTEELFQRARECWQIGPEEPLIFVAAPDFHKGIVGLVASRLTETFYRPSVVVEVEDSHCRGSARSIPELNITQALGECAHLLERFGGHAMAAGFSLASANLPSFQQRLLEVVRKRLEGLDLAPTLDVDAVCSLTHADWQAARALAQLRPFGQGHPTPTLVSRGVLVRDARVVGQGHLRLTVSDGRIVWDAMAFRQAEALASLPPKVDLAYNLEIHHWNGEPRLRLIVRDVRPASGGADQQET